MPSPQKAVLFFEPDETLAGVRPLALEPVSGQPVLFWMVRELTSRGVTRFFVAAPARYADEIRACCPPSARATVSDLHADLMDFLSAPDLVAVLPRAALPVPQAGIGFAYAASGDSLRETWRVRMTNAIGDAIPLGGWIPLYDRKTLEELRPFFQPEPPS